MRKRRFEYWLLEPFAEDELPGSIVEYHIYKEPAGHFQYWGNVIYDKPLTAKEVEQFNLEGPFNVWM